MNFTSIIRLIGVSLALFSFSAQASLITNGDFETGDLSGWETFTTSNGVANSSVSIFDTNGDGIGTNSAEFSVGQAAFVSGVLEGGGITQTFSSGASGVFSIGLDIATRNNAAVGTNLAGGLISLLVDDIVLDFFDFGSISAGSIERSSLFSSLSLDSGLHTLSILIERPFLPSGVVQSLDNIEVTQISAVPVPAAAWLFGSALIGFVGFSRRKIKA